MIDCSQLPNFVSYAQALAVPLTALAVAFGAWIAARQMWIADENLQFDVYDRQYEKRFAVYKATLGFLQSVYHGEISEEDLRAYGLHTLQAKFLFNEDLYHYLRELLQRVTNYARAESSMKESSGEEKATYERIRDENLDWINRQGDEKSQFSVGFDKFLTYTKPARPWWLRYP